MIVAPPSEVHIHDTASPPVSETVKDTFAHDGDVFVAVTVGGVGSVNVVDAVTGHAPGRLDKVMLSTANDGSVPPSSITISHLNPI